MIAQREPTKEMHLVAAILDYSDWIGSMEIPRYQIFPMASKSARSVPDLPERWLISPDKGVGRTVFGQTETLSDSIE